LGLANSYNVLFICTRNSARSIMAEAILNREGKGRFHAYSAGSQPLGRLDPQVVSLLRGLDHDVTGFRSKSWDEFAVAGALAMDFVFTVCDDAAGEICPAWPGHPVTGHWSIPDPAKATGLPAKVQLAYDQAYHMLATRIGILVNLPIDKLDHASLRLHIADIARAELPAV
jgi:arsenate reductase